MSKAEQLAEFNVQDIINYIVEDTGVGFDEAMRGFYASETFDKLMDPETGLYIEGSAYIYGIYQDEQKTGTLQGVNLWKAYAPV